MRVVIDISEDKYSLIQCEVANGMGDWLHKIVANGTPLPKNFIIDGIKKTPTIVEAEREG